MLCIWKLILLQVVAADLSAVFVGVPPKFWGEVLKNDTTVELPDGVPNFLHPDPQSDFVFVRNLTSKDIHDEAELLLFLYTDADGNSAVAGLTILQLEGSFQPTASENLVIVTKGQSAKCLDNDELAGDTNVIFVETEDIGSVDKPEPSTSTSTRAAGSSPTKPKPVVQRPQSVGSLRRLQSEDQSVDFSARVQEGCRCKRSSVDSGVLPLDSRAIVVDCDPYLTNTHVFPLDDLPRTAALSTYGLGLLQGDRENEYIIPAVILSQQEHSRWQGRRKARDAS